MIVCQAFAPATLYSKVTPTASGPPVVALSGTVPESGAAPGLASVTAGAVESTCTRRPLPAGVVNVLPALSVTMMRRS